MVSFCLSDYGMYSLFYFRCDLSRETDIVRSQFNFNIIDPNCSFALVSITLTVKVNSSSSSPTGHDHGMSGSSSHSSTMIGKVP